MSSRTRHPQSLPPPPQPKPLATPPTSPEFSPVDFGTFPRSISLLPRVSPTKRVLRRKKSGLGTQAIVRTRRSKEPLFHEKENQDESREKKKMSSGLVGEERSSKLVKRLRSVRSVPLLSSTRPNDSQAAPEAARSKEVKRKSDRMDKGNEEVLSEESHRTRFYRPRTRTIGDVDEHQLQRYPTSSSSTNMYEFGYPSSAEIDGGFGSVSSGSDHLGHRKRLSSQMGSQGYSSISSGSNFGSVSASTPAGLAQRGAKSAQRHRSETVTTFGGATSGSGSPRSTIRINLGDETPRNWTFERRRGSGASESVGSIVFGRTPQTDQTLRAQNLDIGQAREEVYRRSRDLQRVLSDEASSDLPVVAPSEEEIARVIEPDQESIEEIRDNEEMQKKFLQRHSIDFAHLHQSAGFRSRADQQSLASAASALATQDEAGSSTDRAFDPTENEDERQRRIVEEARREGREKRRSWMLSKAGLAGGPMSPAVNATPFHRRNSSSIAGGSCMSPGFSPMLMSPRVGEITPRAHIRQSSLQGGMRPLALVKSQERRRSMIIGQASDIMLGPPLVISPVEVVPEAEEEEESSDKVGELSRSESSTTCSMSAGHSDDPYISHARNWSNTSIGGGMPSIRTDGHQRGSVHSSNGSGSHGSISRSVSIKSHRRTMSPAQQALPPHLRSFSVSSVSVTNSSMSSLGAVIGGTANSESSCSSGEHIGGPRVLSSDAYNFRMSIAQRKESKSLSNRQSLQLRTESRMTNSTFAAGSLRTESQMTWRNETPDLGFDAELRDSLSEDRESRIKRRRARAFLVAGLKLERNATPANSSNVVAEQDEEWPASATESKKDRRGGIMVETNLNIGEEAMEIVSTPQPIERKRYSVLQREKGYDTGSGSDDVHSPTLRRAGTPLLPFYLKPGKSPSIDEATFFSARQSPVSASSVLATAEPGHFMIKPASPDITISVTEESGIVYPVDTESTPVQRGLPRDDSENSLQDPSAWRAQSGEMMRELFWLPGTSQEKADSFGAGDPNVRRIQSAIGLGAAFYQVETGNRPMSRPPSPALIHPGSAGASPGRERKNSWSNAARGWLRSENKATPEVEVEKGFGLGRGGDSRNTLPSNQTMSETDDPSTRNRPLKEKKSWKHFLGGAKRKRRGSLPEAFRANLPLAKVPVVSQPEQAHVRRSTEPFSQACSEGSPQLGQTPSPAMLSPPAFPSTISRHQANHFSPLSAASFSPQTPENLSTSPGMRIAFPTRTQTAHEYGQSDILSPTPRISQKNETADGTVHKYRSRSSLSEPSLPTALHQSTFEHSRDVSPSRMDMSGKLYGLGLQPVATSPWKGKAKAVSSQEEDAWQQTFARQAVALVQLSNQNQANLTAGTSQAKSIFGDLGRRPDIGIHAKSAPIVSVTGQRDISGSTASRTLYGSDALQVPASATLRPASPTYSYSGTSFTEKAEPESTEYVAATRSGREDHADPRHHDFTTHASATRTMIRKHDQRILPAKFFFMLGFVLPWVWLLGGWALSPAGQFLSSTQIPLSIRNNRNGRNRSSSQTQRKKTGIRSVLPPMSRDRPEKWVKRNRLAAVVSSAVFIPAMCAGFGYLGKFL